MTKEDFNRKIINDAVDILKNDGIIILPTDTVYGLAARSNSEIAINKIYEIKKRNLNQKLPIVIDTYDRLKKLFQINDSHLKKFHPFYPGKLTLVLKRKNSQETVAVRMINNEIINKIIEKLDCPLILTSANVSGEKTSSNITDIITEFDGKVNMIIMGNNMSNISSTIIELQNNEIRLIRDGSIPFIEIEKTFYGR